MHPCRVAPSHCQTHHEFCLLHGRHGKLTKAEMASVAAIATLRSSSDVYAPSPRWTVTLTAKVGIADDGSAGIQTQLLHIDVVETAATRRMMMIKDAVVKAAVTSAYGARFKKVGLLRVYTASCSLKSRRS